MGVEEDCLFDQQRGHELVFIVLDGLCWEHLKGPGLEWGQGFG